MELQFESGLRHSVWTESGLGRPDSVWTQFELACRDSVRTELAIDRSISLRMPSERRYLGVRAESEGRRRRPRPAVGQLPHHRRSIRTGRKLRHELLDLALRPVGGALEDVLAVLQGRCGPSFAMAVRCSRPSASMVRRRGCSREARAAAMRR